MKVKEKIDLQFLQIEVVREMIQDQSLSRDS
jgi:hypothetical protein